MLPACRVRQAVSPALLMVGLKKSPRGGRGGLGEGNCIYIIYAGTKMPHLRVMLYAANAKICK